MKHISRSDAEIASSKLRQLLEKYSLVDRAIIESKNPYNLSAFSKNGLYTSYWITFKEDDSIIKTYKYKIKFIIGGFSAFSLDYKNYERVEKVFAHIPIHLFTVNDKNILMELMAKEHVKVILSDQNYYSEDSCNMPDT